MNKIFDLLFVIPNKIINFIYKIIIAVYLTLLFSYAFLFKALYAVDDKRYLVNIYPVVIVILTVLIVWGLARKRYYNIPIVGYLLSCVISIYTSYRFIAFTEMNVHVTSKERLLAFACCCYILFLAINSIFAMMYKIICSKVFNTSQFVKGLIVCFTINFVVNYYLPAESFFGSFSDYAFPYQILAKAFISVILFWSIVPAILFAILKENIFKKLYAIVVGLLLAIYIQYLFFNKYMGSINGLRYDWKEHVAFAIINIALWILLLVGAMFLVGKSPKVIKVYSFLTIYIMLIHLVTYATLLINAEEKCFQYSATYFSFENQFKVAKEDNVIVFIIDAADNKFLKELYKENNRFIDDFNDFTMYTNTCSVYDYTSLSLLQMITNFKFDNMQNNVERREAAWNTEHVNEFFNRLHSSGYNIEVYNFDNENTPNIIGKIDNAVSFDSEKDKVQYIGYKKIRKAISQISTYSVAPCILKQYVKLSDTSFAKAIVYRNQIECYSNEDFMRNLELSYSDNNKSVIYQHIDGCHPPKDDTDTMSYCMQIASEYINQMKELGVYDNATIIVTADHGIIDPSDVTGKDMEAATPILLIKKAGEKHDTLLTCGAPVYHTDLMATVLLSAGLYDSNDARDIRMFGKTFYDYNEDEERERIWYDRVNDSNYDSVGVYNTFYEYKFTGDTAEFERIVENGENLTIYPVQMHND